jgi:hypothetical protein
MNNKIVSRPYRGFVWMGDPQLVSTYANWKKKVDRFYQWCNATGRPIGVDDLGDRYNTEDELWERFCEMEANS